MGEWSVLSGLELARGISAVALFAIGFAIGSKGRLAQPRRRVVTRVMALLVAGSILAHYAAGTRDVAAAPQKTRTAKPEPEPAVLAPRRDRDPPPLGPVYDFTVLDLRITGEGDRLWIRRGISMRRVDVRYCFQANGAWVLGARDATVRFVVHADGTADRGSFPEGSDLPRRVEECVLRAFSLRRFRPSAGDALVRVKLRFLRAEAPPFPWRCGND